MARALRILSIGLALAATAVRADPATPLPPAEQQSLDAFSAAHKDCNAWSDGCVICRRLQDAAYACSTPGIACEPKRLACQTAPETPAEATKPAPVPPAAPNGAH